MSKMLNALREARNTAASAAEALLAAEPTTDTLEAVEARHAEIKTLDSQIESAEALEARTATIAEARAISVPTFSGAAVITKEAKTYEERGEFSFAKDMVNAFVRNDVSSWDRLNRHRDEVAVETRDLNRTDTSGGEFTPPMWLVDFFAGLPRAARVAADRCTTMALPGGTDSISIPRITTGSTVAAQASDNAALSNTDMVTATVTAPVQTIGGYEDVAVQLVDQSPLAGGLDRLIFADLAADYAYKLNQQVISNNDGTSGTLKGLINAASNTVTWTEATPLAASGIAAMAKSLSTLAKNRYAATEAFIMSPEHWYWLSSAVDSSNRPLVVPVAGGNASFNSSGTVVAPGAAQGMVGYIHGVPVYVDSTIPTISSQKYILAGKFSDSYLFESALRTAVFPDTKSDKLTVRFRLHSYVALAHRYPAGLAKITGTGLVPATGY
jgi:HK97 family phage major capsid protein